MTTYEADIRGMLAMVGTPIASTTLADLQAGIESFKGRVPASRAQKIGVVKSLLSLAERTGLLSNFCGAGFAIKGGPRGSPATYESVARPSAVPESARIGRTMRAAAVLAGL